MLPNFLHTIKEINMEALQYKVIKSQTQFNKYNAVLQEIVGRKKQSKSAQEEAELLTLLTEKWESENTSFKGDPIVLLKQLMEERSMKGIDLARILKVSAGLVSDILNYKKGLSKQSIRVLSETFNTNQQAFNRPYKWSIPSREKAKVSKAAKPSKSAAAAKSKKKKTK